MGFTAADVALDSSRPGPITQQSDAAHLAAATNKRAFKRRR